MDQLEKQLADAQWLGGQQPSAADREAFDGLSGAVPDVEQFPHTFAWYSLVSKFTPAVKATWTGAQPAAAKGGKKAEEKKAEVKTEEKKEAAPAKTEDDFDPFAEEMDDEEKEQMERMKAKAAAAGKGNKKPIVAKSLILWEIKPWGADTDLDVLAAKVLQIEMDGLEWKTEYKKEPIAFGVNKLVMGCVVEDEKVATDDVQEKIQAIQGEPQPKAPKEPKAEGAEGEEEEQEYDEEEDNSMVQSVDIAAFNKL